MKLATYEKFDLKATKRVRVASGFAMLIIAVYVSFWTMPPVAWVDDAPGLATGPWLWHTFSVWYGAFLAQQHSTVPGSSQLVAALTALWRIPIALGIGIEFYSRMVGCTAASFTAWFAASAVMIRVADVVDTRKHVEGLELQRGSNAVKSISGFMGQEDHEPGLGISLCPGVMLSRLREIRGVLLLGAPGSGKTRIILYLLDQILAAMRRFPKRNIKLLVHDTTGEILRGLPLADNEFAALHGHRPGGYAWAAGRDVITKTDAEALGALLAPRTQESIWEAGSGTLLAGCAVLCQHEHGTAWGIPEFYEALLQDPAELKRRLQPIYRPAADLIEIDKDTGGLSRTTMSFFLSFRANVLRFLRPLAENWQDIPPKRQISFRKWLDGSNRALPQVVVVQRSGRYPELSSAWIGAIVDTITAHVSDESFENSQTRRIFLCLDELAALGRLRRFQEALEIGRNKGVGILAAALHEIEQLQEIYGDRIAKIMVGKFRTKIICQQNLDGSTARFSENIIGKRTIEVERTSTTKTDGPQVKPTSTTADEQKEVPIVRGERLAYELGVVGNRVKAIVVGAGDPALLKWPVTVWPRRR